MHPGLSHTRSTTCFNIIYFYADGKVPDFPPMTNTLVTYIRHSEGIRQVASFFESESLKATRGGGVPAMCYTGITRVYYKNVLMFFLYMYIG